MKVKGKWTKMGTVGLGRAKVDAVKETQSCSGMWIKLTTNWQSKKKHKRVTDMLG